MRPVPSMFVRPALLVAGLALLAVPLAAQESLPIDATWTRPSALESQLAARVSLTSAELSVQGLVELLRQQFSINVKIDERALADVGLSGDEKISGFELTGVVLEAALNSLLKERRLTTRVSDEILIITTPEEAENFFETRMYPVVDLVTTGLPGRRASNVNQDDYDTLIHVITSSIAPDSWAEVGGAGSIEAFPASRALVISQTREVHQWLAPFLATLRRAQFVSRAMLPSQGAPASEVGSRPYQPHARGAGVPARSRAQRYVYRTRGAWQVPRAAD